MDLKLLKDSAVSAGIAFLSAAAMLLVMSGVLYTSGDPDKYMILFAGAVLLMSVLVCGFTASRMYRENTALCGLTSGIVFAVVLLAVSLFMPGEGFGFGINSAIAAAMAGISALTALICKPRAKRARHRPRRK